MARLSPTCHLFLLILITVGHGGSAGAKDIHPTGGGHGLGLRSTTLEIVSMMDDLSNFDFGFGQVSGDAEEDLEEQTAVDEEKTLPEIVIGACTITTTYIFILTYLYPFPLLQCKLRLTARTISKRT